MLAVSWITDKNDDAAYSPSVELDGCGCLTDEEHMTRCVLWTVPGLVVARPMLTPEERRARARARMTRWRRANPERWREIQRRSDAKHGRLAA